MAGDSFRSMLEGCSIRADVVGSAIYGSFVTALAATGWYFGGAVVAIVAFLVGVGVAFMLMDVGALPTDEDCAEVRRLARQATGEPTESR